MIRNISVVNEYGDSISSRFDDAYTAPYVITGMDEYGPVSADINLTQYAVTDGALYNSARIPERNLVMTLTVVQGAMPSIEHARHWIYRVYAVKSFVTLTFETDTGSYTTTGHIEKCEPDMFQKLTKVKVTIVCNDPYFYGPKNINQNFSATIGGFEFPFSNEGPLDGVTLLDGGRDHWHRAQPSNAKWVHDVNHEAPYLIDLFIKTDSDTFPEGGRERWYNAWDDGGRVFNSYQRTSVGGDMTHSALVDGIISQMDFDLGGTVFYLACPHPEDNEPHLKDFVNTIGFGEIKSYSTTDITYNGITDNGFIIRTYLHGQIDVIPKLRYNDSINPSRSLEIDMAQVKSKIGGQNFATGDYMEVSTRIGNKYVRVWHNKQFVSCLNAVGPTPYWPRIKQGNNKISCLVVGNNANQYAVEHEIEFSEKYQGI